MGLHRSRLTQSLADVLDQHGAQGIAFCALAAMFPAVDRRRVSQALHNLQARQQAHLVKATPTTDAMWFAGEGGRTSMALTPTAAKRIHRARLLDQTDPLRYYGQNLHPPRVASVWAYARYFQENRA